MEKLSIKGPLRIIDIIKFLDLLKDGREVLVSASGVGVYDFHQIEMLIIAAHEARIRQSQGQS